MDHKQSDNEHKKETNVKRLLIMSWNYSMKTYYVQQARKQLLAGDAKHKIILDSAFGPTQKFHFNLKFIMENCEKEAKEFSV